jgi:hypothetical protein
LSALIARFHEGGERTRAIVERADLAELATVGDRFRKEGPSDAGG